MEDLKDRRLDKFNAYETEDAVKILEKRKKRQQKRLERKIADAMNNPNSNIDKLREQLQAENEAANTMEIGEKKDTVYLICSGFDWLPHKMKTRMNLSIEKIGM